MFDISIHIIDHAQFLLGKLDDANKIIHFNSSVCASYFLRQGIEQSKIDDIMISILKNIEKRTLQVREKNGVYNKKNGIKVQKYRVRKIRFDKIFMAYHNRHFDSSRSVNPHFHFLFDSKSRMGKDFKYLKQALEIEANKYNIKFNFMEQKRNTGLTQKQLSLIERMSWLLNEGNVQKIVKYLKKENNLKRALDLLIIHYQNTQNISYFLKILSILNQRLQELDIDFIYDGINLKENIFFFLDEHQQQLILDIRNRKEVYLDLSNVLDREIFKKSYGYNSDVVDILSDRFNISEIDRLKIKYKTIPSKNLDTKIKKNDFQKLIIQDMRDALSFAKNEKEWKQFLLTMGYQKISIKTSKSKNGKRVKIGLNIVTKKGSKVYIPFYMMRINYRKIMSIMMFNKNKNKNRLTFHSRLDEFKKNEFKVKNLKKYEHQMKLLLELYSNNIDQKTDINKLDKFAKKYTIERSELYNALKK